jgi:PEP-CTERM motif
MKRQIISLAILCLALASLPAFGQGCQIDCYAYDNGPINGSVNAWTINFGYVVSNDFYWGGAGKQIDGFMFGIWELPNDVLTSVGWSITTAENGGTVLGSGTVSGSNLTDKFISTNQYGYDVDMVTATGFLVGAPSGSRDWLNLQNAVVPSGNPVYWDENSGAGCSGTDCPSQASESAVGTIPSEAFTVSGSNHGTTPEPSSFILFASGTIGLAGLVRRKLL